MRRPPDGRDWTARRRATAAWLAVYAALLAGLLGASLSGRLTGTAALATFAAAVLALGLTHAAARRAGGRRGEPLGRAQRAR